MMFRPSASDTSCYNCAHGRIVDSRPFREPYKPELQCRCLAYNYHIGEYMFMEFSFRRDCVRFRRHNATGPTV